MPLPEMILAWRLYYDFDKNFLIELEPCSAHYEMYDS
jgi:hypothetical protein